MDQNIVQQGNKRAATEVAAAAAAAMDTVARQQQPPLQPCPRCNSTNTKFCYYNNYSLSQPRYFCKGCRRYWTHGGTLRNVPVGGGCRKSKRPKLSATATTTTAVTNSQLPLPPATEITAVATAPAVPFYGGGSGGGGDGGFLTSLVGQSVGFGPNLGLFHGLGLPTTTEVGREVVENQGHVSFQELLQRRHESDVSSYQVNVSGRLPTNEGGGATSGGWNISHEDGNTNHWPS